VTSRFSLKGDLCFQEIADALNAPREAAYCERCKTVHPARPAGAFDRMIQEQARAVAEAIDAEYLLRVSKV